MTLCVYYTKMKTHAFLYSKQLFEIVIPRIFGILIEMPFIFEKYDGTFYSDVICNGYSYIVFFHFPRPIDRYPLVKLKIPD